MFSTAIRTQARSLALKTPFSLSSTQTRSLSTLLSSRSTTQSCSSFTWQSARAFSAGIPRLEEEPASSRPSRPRRSDRSEGSQPRGAPLFYRKPAPPSTTVFVGNLPYSIDENEIHRLFSQFGQIEDIRLAIGPDGRMRGYAHIDFATQEAASNVVDSQVAEPAFVNGRQLRIDYAPAKNVLQNAPHTNLYIGEFGGAQEDLHKAFAEFSQHIKATRMLRDPVSGQLTGKCFVEFDSIPHATEALEKLNKTVSKEGFKLNISYANNKGDRKPRRQ